MSVARMKVRDAHISWLAKGVSIVGEGLFFAKRHNLSLPYILRCT